MTSSLSLLTDLSRQKGKMVLLTAQTFGLLRGIQFHKRKKNLETVVDAYIVERLRAGTAMADLSAEVGNVLDTINRGTTIRTMVRLVENQFPMTACGILQRHYNFNLNEARLGLVVLQLCVKDYLTAELNEAKVEPEEAAA